MAEMNERGSIELLLLLLFLLILQVGLFLLSHSLSSKMRQAYDHLNLSSEINLKEPEVDEVFGQDHLDPPPRLDFGANNQRNMDAGALCYVVSRFGCERSGTNFRCN